MSDKRDAVFYDRVEQLRAQVSVLQNLTKTIETNKAFRIYEGLMRIKAALFKGERVRFVNWIHNKVSDSAYQPIHQIYEQLQEIQANFDNIFNISIYDYLNLRIFDGQFSTGSNQRYMLEVFKWADVEMIKNDLSTRINPNPTALLLLSSKKEALQTLSYLKKLRSLGVDCYSVSATNEEFSDYSASQALAIFGGQQVILVCVSAVCAPFVDYFRFKTIWYLNLQIDDDLKCAAYSALNERMKSLSSINGNSLSWAEMVLPEHEKCVLCSSKKKVLIILGTINYDFQTQRPQHIASQYASMGYSVYYINADFAQKSNCSRSSGVTVVTLPLQEVGANNIYSVLHAKEQQKVTNILREIVKQIVFANNVASICILNEYPLWHSSAVIVKNEFNCALVADYLDDYMSFPNESNNCILHEEAQKMIQESDLTIVTSDYLADRAQKAKSLITIRNAAEFEHFANAKRHSENTKPVVGYFGVISDWFDIKIIEALEKSNLDITVRLIGSIKDKLKSDLEKFKKVELIDMVAYAELPDYLVQFDVCIIPFETKSNLIKATNPVKFYEYLCAGKKIVCTEIPELLPYKNRLAYLENEPNKFVECVRLCLNGEDTLASEQACKEFAKENSWQARCKQMEAITNSLALL
ncbi:MAG: glycosyltransferase [Christensenella sp.]